MRPKDLVVWSVGIVMALILTIYACDFLWFEYRKWTPKPDDPLETFTFFYATRIKNGRMEVFYDQPQKALACTRSFRTGATCRAGTSGNRTSR